MTLEVNHPQVLTGNLAFFLRNLGLTVEQIKEADRTIDARIQEAIDRIEKSPFILTTTTAYVGHSGGKDSVLVRYLADRYYTDRNGDILPTVHTTKPDGVPNAVHPRTQKFLYQMQRPILYVPLENTEKANLGFKVQIDGTRIAEHNRDDGRSIDVVINGESVSRKQLPLYLENGLFGLNFIYPIYDWSDAEVWAAILLCGIPFSEEYLLYQGGKIAEGSA